MAKRKRKLRAYKITVSKEAKREVYLISAFLQADAVSKAHARFHAAHGTSLYQQASDTLATAVEELDG